jgi:pimeloyl-ACP methyl ester carboxylesterase
MPFILFDHKRIFYRIEGHGSPVLLLHGFGEDGNIWNRQIQTLAEKHLLIIPDLPGSGSSETLEGNNTALADYAEVVKAIVADAAGIADKDKPPLFSLIGHSMGGYITLAFAEKYPDYIHSFGLFHSSAYADDEQKKAARKKGIDFIRKNGSEAFLKNSVPNLFSASSKKEMPQRLNELFDLAKTISPEALIRYYEAMMARPDRTQVLRSFPGPVLFIAGKSDSAVPLPVSLLQASIPRQSFFHILQHSAHMGMWEEPDLSTSFILDFLQNI